MDFDKKDPDYNNRIIRHNNWHNPKYKGKTREHNGSYNITKKRNTVMGVPKYES